MAARVRDDEETRVIGETVKKNRVSLLFVVLLISIPVMAFPETLWVPAVAHVPGVGTSQWRTDVGVLNLCPSDAVVEIRLHTGDGQGGNRPISGV